MKDGGLGVKRMFLEKDYWVTRSLRMLAESRFAEQDVVRNMFGSLEELGG